MWILALVFCVHTMCPKILQAQGKTHVSGVVYDVEGNIIEATVRYKGGSKSVIQGKFSIELENLPDTIRITAVGYETVERVVTKGGSIIIRMYPLVNVIEEVKVYTGYQTLAPNEVNGTVTVIGANAIQDRASGNLFQRLLGHSSGLLNAVGKEGSATGLTVRGLGTINGPLDPLVVLDGFIYEGSIENIDPNDVESVSILKDASAASIWGARAGNGVIVITSKKGRLNEKMKVSLNFGKSLREIPLMAEQKRIGASEYVELEKFLFNQGFFDRILSLRPYQQVTPVIESLLQRREGRITDLELEDKLAFWSSQDSRKAFKDEFYSISGNENYQLQFHGGAEKFSFLMAGSYNRQKSPTQDITDQINLRINNEFNITKSLNIGVNVRFSSNTESMGRPRYGSIRIGGRDADYLTFRDSEGNQISLDREFRSLYVDSISRGKLLDWNYYPLTNDLSRTTESKRQGLFGSINLNYKLLTFLNLSGSFQYGLESQSHLEEDRIESYEARNLINQFSSIDPQTGIVSRVIPLGAIRSSRSSAIGSFTYRGQVDFRQQWGFHRVISMVGMEFQGRSSTSANHGRQFGYSADPLAYANVDLLGLYPNFVTGQLGRVGASTSLSQKDYRFVSLYSNFLYSFKNRYMISASARRDGSNLFGVNANDRWNPLWSTGIGWDISNENFYDFSYIPHIKLSITYGVSGNVDLNKTALPIIQYGTNNLTNLRFARILSINNPNLQWERLSQLSSKLEVSTKDEKVRIGLHAFKKYGEDLYGEAPYDITTWGQKATITRNVGSMEGYGIELDLHTINFQSRNFEWKSSFYFNWNDDKVTAYHESLSFSQPYAIMVGAGDRKISPFVGFPLYNIAAYKWNKLNNQGDPQGFYQGSPSTNYLNITNEAVASGDNIIYFGSASPRYYGSLIKNFRFRDLSVVANLSYSMAYFVRKPTISYGSLVNYGIGHKDYLGRWKVEGDELITEIPKFVYPVDTRRDNFYSFSENNVIRGDNIRLDYVRLIYEIPTKKWTHPFHQLAVNVGLENIGPIWVRNKQKLDPNFLNSDPPSKLWSLGVKILY